MEARKYPAADLEHYKMLFYSIGLVASLIIVIVAFEWKFYDNGDIANLGGDVDAMFDEVLDIPPTEQPPPPPPKTVKLTNLVEVQDIEDIEDEIEITIDVEMTEDMVVEEVEAVEVDEVEEEVAEEIFSIVEDYPQPVGGMDSFYKYIYTNITYPKAALRAGIQGKVFLQFVVSKDGTIRELVVVKGIGAGCDEEALRVFKEAPAWKPGKQRGKPVAVRMIVPIQFKILE